MALRYWVGGTDTWDATAGTKWALTSGGAGGQSVPSAADDVFFDAASGAVTCTWSATSPTVVSINCAGFTGTLATGGNSKTLSGSTLLWTSPATCTITGAPTITASSVNAGTRIVSCNHASPSATNSINFTFATGSHTVALSGTGFRNLSITFPGVVTGTVSVYGNVTLGATGTSTNFSPTFLATATYSGAGRTIGDATVNAPGATVTTSGAMTLGVTNTFTLTAGTLSLGGLLSTGIFSSSNTNTRAIAFGANNIALTSTTSSTTVLSMADATNFTLSGTGGFTRNNAAVAIAVFGTTGGSTTNAPRMSINGGSANFVITNGSWFTELSYIGMTGGANTGSVNLAGALSLSPSASYINLNPTFRANGSLNVLSLINFGTVTVNGAGITVTLSSTGSTAITGVALQQGTLNITSNLTAGSFTASTSNVRALTLSSSIVFTVTLSLAAWNIVDATNLTFTPNTSTISMNNSSAKTFVGGGLTYYNLRQSGSGALTIQGNNTFNDITNTVQPNTVTFTAGTTQTVSNFSLSGTAGNLITINSTTGGSQATLSKASGIVTGQYLSIQDSNATGGATWSAGGSSSLGNNTGWAITDDFRRYWVGGTGDWTTTSTTNWSPASGGAGGASVPTASNSVFFDQAGPYTVTMGAGGGTLTCLDFTVSGASVTFNAGASHNFYVYGSFTLASTTVWNQTWGMSFQATTTGKTITTNGVSLGVSMGFNGVNGGWTLGSALNISGGLQIDSGTFSTSVSNYAVTALQISTNGSPPLKTINLNASTITLSGITPLSITAPANLIINAGTSQINLTSSGSPVIALGGYTYYNIALTSTTLSNPTITGANTFNNFSVTGTAATGVATVNFSANQTINGALTTTGIAGNRRVFFASATYGIGFTLTVNSAPSLTDADFRDIYVKGTAAPISGTRIGNRGNCSGITFSTPKTVYRYIAASTNTDWSFNLWAATSGGAVSTDNFPLPQDTAVINNTSMPASSGLQLDGVIPYVPTVDMSTRTSAFTFYTSNGTTVYGNWTNGSGVLLQNAGTLTFSGGRTQTITSAGKTFSGGITVDTYGGTVQLADALNISPNTLNVTNGTFTTAGYNITAGSIFSSNSNVRTINMGASTFTSSSSGSLIDFGTSTNLTFNAGTSQITFTDSAFVNVNASNQTFYNLSYTGFFTGKNASISGINNTFNNITVTAPLSGIASFSVGANQTINGTLNCSGTTAIKRIFLQSSTLGTQRTLTVNSLSADDCDFRDIVLAGTASGTAPTRAGNCGNNSGITFPTAKTVYWNLAGTQNWSATGWCTASGGTPAVNNFPLPQDTAVFNNAGSITTVSVDDNWKIGTLDASARTGAMTLNASLADTSIYGDLKLGSGVTTTGSGNLAFWKFGTQTITCNGASLNLPVGPASLNTVLQLADAFTSSKGIYIANSGTFDSANFNVTISTFSIINVASVLKMGTSTWTITSAQLWSWDTSITSSTIFAGQSNIVFSNNSTTARGFVAAASQYYNKITIGGSAISTFVIQGALILGELASTKTTAHTITLYSSTTYNIGKWSVTGTVGNVVTVQPGTAATVYTLNIIGPANTGIDYLSISYCDVSTSSLGEFYVGANSTNVLGNSGPIIFTATPSPSTRYWRGGTGTWNATNTTSWASASGGAGPASVPTSVDTVIFDSASNATAYTVTVSTAAARCGTLIIGGPAAGNLTINSSAGIPLIAHGDVRFAATGVISTSMSGGIVLSGSATNQPFVSDVLVVGGGGAGGHLGGGGAGGHRYFTNQSLVANTNYTVTVGEGGPASTGVTGNQGLNSVFNIYTSAGGGGGAGESALPTAGGSGGGGGGIIGSRSGAAGNTPSTSPSQGNTGGNGNDNGAGTAFAGGGGGGAGGTGDNASGATTAGNGGLGTANSITGTSVTRAAGGAGGAYQYTSTGTAGTGGSSIGGNGGRNGLNATGGSPNTGSGGGGNGYTSDGNLQGSSGAGGSGVVIIKYLNNLTISNPGGGLTFTTDSASVAGYNITTFTAGTGQISFNATTSRLFTTNGVALTAGIQINGVGCGWTLGSSLNIGSNTLTVTNGTFSTSASNYSVTCNSLSSSNSNVRTINLNGSTVNAAGTGPVAFTNYINHTFNAGTSTIDCSSGFPTFLGGGLTYYNVSFTSPVTNPIISGANTFNNLFITGRTGVGLNVLFINNANQTINGTFTVSAGTTAACRTFIITGTIGTAITLTCAAVSLTDVDFRDITIAGSISSVTFNTPGAQTWTVPAGVTSATIKLWGAGGGSGGNGYIEGGGGGGGGAFASKVLTVTPAQVLSFTVGVGGGAGGYNGFGQTVGTTGGASTHSAITAGGGLGGGDGTGGAGGTASGGDVNTTGQSGFGSFQGANSYKGGLAGNSPNATAASAIVPYSGLQPGGGQGGGGGDFAGKGGDGRVTFEWSAISLPVTGTRLGNCKGNSGITFPAAKTVYYGQIGSADWGATGSGSWSATSSGPLDATMFPLAQDTAVFPEAIYPASGSTTTINQAFNTGTIDMSLRTSNTMTLAINTSGLGVYGNWINGTGITISGTGTIAFTGRTTQQITSSAKTFTQPINITSPSGSVTLQDALTTNTTVATTLTAGTLNLNNFTLTTGTFVSSGSVAKTITFGSGTIGVYSTGTVWNMGTVTINKGTGTILLGNTSTTGRTFAGGGLSYPKLSIGGATGISTLTITGNNTFAEITSTKTVANTISLGTTTQTVEAWTATGTASNLLTITGTSAASPATLILTGAIKPNVDYSEITGVRAYPLADTWYALTSTNNGSLGFIYNAGLAALVKKLYLGGSNTLSVYYGSKPVNSIYYGSVKIFG